MLFENGSFIIVIYLIVFSLFPNFLPIIQPARKEPIVTKIGKIIKTKIRINASIKIKVKN